MYVLKYVLHSTPNFTDKQMKLLIHKGTNEIGGSCIQLSTAKTTILIDAGLPLSKSSIPTDVANIRADALLISHPHQDHYGLMDAVDHDMPVYIGSFGLKLIEASRVLIGKTMGKRSYRPIQRDKKVTIGDFTVTPYLVDHSAVDAYAFLIEAEGKRIFYSGDFRAHGKKAVLFEKMVQNPPKDIDLLLMEGTMLRRSNDEFPKESDVEERIYQTIKVQKNIGFIISSSQNIDRVVSAYRACLRADKILVLDFYTAWVLEKLREMTSNVPTMEWKSVAVYADHNQDEILKKNEGYFGDFRKRAYAYRIKKEELRAGPSRYLVFSKMSRFKIMNSYRGPSPVGVIYSQWPGYLKCTNKEYYGAEEINAFHSDPGINYVYAHTSGHATVADLRAFASALKPKKLIPIHTEHKGEFQKHFENVILCEDGKIFDLADQNTRSRGKQL